MNETKKAGLYARGGRGMITCSDCPRLISRGEYGDVVVCTLTRKSCFLDELPWTTMDGCPRKAEQAGKDGTTCDNETKGVMQH